MRASRNARRASALAAPRPAPVPGGLDAETNASAADTSVAAIVVHAAVGAVVVVQEDLLERGLAARERLDRARHRRRRARRSADRCCRRPRSAARSGQRSRRGPPAAPASCGVAPANVTSTVCAARWRSCASVPSSTSLPLPRMPTRSHSASTSLRMCEERKTVCPRCLASCTHSRNAISISGSRPDVGSSSSSSSARVASAAISCTFWRLPFDSARIFLRVSSWKRSHEHVAVGDVGAAVHAREELERLGARQRRPQEGLAGDVGDTAVRGDGVAPGVDAEQLTEARGGPVQPEQQPDRGRLAGAVGTEVAVHLAALHRQVERVERERVAVALAQALRADRRDRRLAQRVEVGRVGAVRVGRGLECTKSTHECSIRAAPGAAIRGFPACGSGTAAAAPRVRALPQQNGGIYGR